MVGNSVDSLKESAKAYESQWRELVPSGKLDIRDLTKVRARSNWANNQGETSHALCAN